ncbi:MAG: hypothetical protein M3R15_23390 [Acidobacteriota bacterium]|nr:hypothetical protein [Acidobacteriota bacterium]
MRLMGTFFLTFALLCITVPALSFNFQNNERAEVKFPPGKWSLTYPPISILSLEDAPAKIISTTGDVKNGVTITEVGLENRSSKAISAVKFRWYLFTEGTPKKIVSRGETPVVGMGEFASGKKRIIEYPIVSFGNIYRPLVKDGRLTGKFVIEVAVSEILYADGSSWKRS